ncbi:MAG: heat-shock protein [Gemmataceae bacterium]
MSSPHPEGEGRLERVETRAASPSEVYAPALDIYESAEGLVIEADLPGVPDELLEVRVEENNRLTLFGRVRWPVPAEARCLVEEIRPGDYFRSFILSEQVDTERIAAEFSDGVLRLVLPRATRARLRRIEIRTPTRQPRSEGHA